MWKNFKISNSKIFAKFKKTGSQPNVSNDLGNSKTTVWSKILNALQALGKTIQFPIAVLPFAAILNRFGALGMTYAPEDTNPVGYWISYIIKEPGGLMFDNLPLLFAIGIAFGLAKDHRGEVAIASVAFYLITVGLTSEHSLPELIYGKGKIMSFTTSSGVHYSELFYTPVYDKDNPNVINGASYQLSIGVFGGIIAGCMSAYLYNKFKNIQLPKALSFFGGRRFVPMLSIIAAVPISFAYAIIWPWIQLGLFRFSSTIISHDSPNANQIGGTLVFGILNRLLLAFGLHMVLNALVWFQLPVTGFHVDSGFSWNPDMVSSITYTVNGDINAFSKGIFGAGKFQSGFFPIMMGGLPAAVIAMIFVAPKENRHSVAGFLGAAAGISFLTGITEPIEYSFIFISPILLLVHALFTGLSCAIVAAMHIHVGFGFSAGFIDYAISIPQSWGFSLFQGHGNAQFAGNPTLGVTSNPLWILVIAAGFFFLYFVTFTAIIKRMDIKTPGRELDYVATPEKPKKVHSKSSKKEDKLKKYKDMAKEIIDAIGIENIEVVDNCATRLRLELKDNTNIDSKKIKETGVFGIKKLGTKSLQIIVGPDVEHLANFVHELTKK